MICENCQNKHDGNYGSGRFCCCKCSKSFSTKNKRKEINDKVSLTLLSRSKRKIKSEKNIQIIQKFLCKYCGNPTKRRGEKYCSAECNQNDKYDEYISKWKNGEVDGSKCQGYAVSNYVRKYLWKKYKGKCSRCGWDKPNPTTKKPVLEIEHIDGNSMNNKEKNLDLICPNCHSLTLTYKALNTGKGNRNKHKYFGLIK